MKRLSNPKLKDGTIGLGLSDVAKEVDRAVTRILSNLRRGQSAHLPGVGTLTPGKPWKFRPDDQGKRK